MLWESQVEWGEGKAEPDMIVEELLLVVQMGCV